MLWRVSKYFFVVISLIIIYGCKERQTSIETPWGATVEMEGTGKDDADTASSADAHYSLEDIQQGGEMIMLTLSGPETYYDYHGKSMGAHYLLCEKLAGHLHVKLRVDVCRDTTEMLKRLSDGEGDIIAYPMTGAKRADFVSCAAGWLTRKDSKDLTAAITAWYKSGMMAEVKKEEQVLLSRPTVTRRIYPVMLSATKGQISSYDIFFRKYAAVAGMDWVMMAAQCYQESCFDPKAHSWAGACGLMQIMPATADHLALPRGQMYEPEPNIAAAARYMRELQGLFRDVANPVERQKFALAAYNGGYHHIRDAMALAGKYGGSAQRWHDVRRYVLLLADSRYYRDAVVRNGYMRGSETAAYVDMIMERYASYRDALHSGKKIVSSVKQKSYDVENFKAPETSSAAAHRAVRKNKWRKD